MKREFLQGLQVEGAPLPKEIIDAIMAETVGILRISKITMPTMTR